MAVERKPAKKWFGLDDRTEHRKFEDYCENYLQRRYSGYDIKGQHKSNTSSTVIDFFGINKKTGHRFTAEAKHVKILTKAHIDQASDVYPRYPNEKLILIPSITEYSNDVEEYAYRKNVEIVTLKADFHPLYLRWEDYGDGTSEISWKP